MTMIPPRVVPANAGTHNHRPWFLAKLVAPAIAKLAAVVMGPGSALRLSGTTAVLRLHAQPLIKPGGIFGLLFVHERN